MYIYKIPISWSRMYWQVERNGDTRWIGRCPRQPAQWYLWPCPRWFIRYKMADSGYTPPLLSSQVRTLNRSYCVRGRRRCCTDTGASVRLIVVTFEGAWTKYHGDEIRSQTLFHSPFPLIRRGRGRKKARASGDTRPIKNASTAVCI